MDFRMACPALGREISLGECREHSTIPRGGKIVWVNGMRRECRGCEVPEREAARWLWARLDAAGLTRGVRLDAAERAVRFEPHANLRVSAQYLSSGDEWYVLEECGALGRTHFHPDDEDIFAAMRDRIAGETVFVSKWSLVEIGRVLTPCARVRLERRRRRVLAGIGTRVIDADGVHRARDYAKKSGRE